MADEAFALSPISARAAQPSEEDYDAISKAFMETSRGRWFLGEYAKRNRNADTSMVLEAVARLEENLAAQRQPQPAPDDGLREALAAIRTAVDQARVAALDGLALEEKLGPVRKGSRIIREIAWRWREIGADSRICDLIDSQITAIEGACGEIASINPLAAFDVIERQLAELGGSETAPTSPQAAVADSPSAAAPPTPSDEMLAALVEPLETAAAAPADDSEATVRASSVLAEEAIAAAEAETVMADTADVTAETAAVAIEAMDAMAETADVTVETVDAMTETMDAAAEPAGLTAEAAEAQDDAILDMIALEMAADDPTDVDEVAELESAEIAVAELAPADPVSVAPEPEPEPIAAAAVPPAAELSLQPALQAAEEPSLGASLISRGILSRPQAAAADPLAPIRRMSQAEKIALFS
ncbi:hypothetical protein [Bradyrhizobium sp.]|uniref:hypothetical protein n=1 Tax=Bradyrhizobium sp. TaxID=376 RepID=UPI0027375F0A|nr:hypothetical protein [Bradyrhizobium sp.]MDP3077486.1 hypothetical protein [Bradyrhizobium sp.]